MTKVSDLSDVRAVLLGGDEVRFVLTDDGNLVFPLDTESVTVVLDSGHELMVGVQEGVFVRRTGDEREPSPLHLEPGQPNRVRKGESQSDPARIMRIDVGDEVHVNIGPGETWRPLGVITHIATRV